MGTRAATSKASKAVAADVVTAAKAALSASAARKASSAKPTPALSAADRENPEKLTGEALRDLAHRRGVSRSEAEGMSDEKLRMQLRYITHRQYAED